MTTVPEVGRSSPARQCISVDLPEPDGPMIAVSRPRGEADGDAVERPHGGLALAEDAAEVRGADDRVRGSLVQVELLSRWGTGMVAAPCRALNWGFPRPSPGGDQGRAVSPAGRAPTGGRRRSRPHGRGSSSAWPRARPRRTGPGRRRRPRPRRSSRSANVVNAVATTLRLRPSQLDRADVGDLGVLPHREPARVAVADRGGDRCARIRSSARGARPRAQTPGASSAQTRRPSRGRRARRRTRGRWRPPLARSRSRRGSASPLSAGPCGFGRGLRLRPRPGRPLRRRRGGGRRGRRRCRAARRRSSRRGSSFSPQPRRAPRPARRARTG